jgi:hypothetical protein
MVICFSAVLCRHQTFDFIHMFLIWLHIHTYNLNLSE